LSFPTIFPFTGNIDRNLNLSLFTRQILTMTSSDEDDEIPTPPRKASPPMTSLGFRQYPRGVTEMGSVGVEVTRERRANMNFRELQSLHTKATVGMKTKFVMMRETSLTEMYYLQARITAIQKRLRYYSMKDVFIIRTLFDSCGNIVDDGGPRDLFKSYRDLSMKQIRRSNEFYHYYGTDEHHQDLLWSGQMLANSIDPNDSLGDRIQAKIDAYDPIEQGGPLYFKVLLDLIT
jgi:hypothetical protein